MIDNVLLSPTLGLHMPFYWTTPPLWGNLGAQPLGPGTPLGSFETGKKKDQKGACDGGRPNRYKATRKLNAMSLCAGPALKRGRGGQAGEGSKGSFRTSWPPFAPVRKAATVQLQRTKLILNQWKPLPQDFAFNSLASLDLPWEMAPCQSHLVTERFDSQILSTYTKFQVVWTWKISKVLSPYQQMRKSRCRKINQFILDHRPSDCSAVSWTHVFVTFSALIDYFSKLWQIKECYYYFYYYLCHPLSPYQEICIIQEIIFLFSLHEYFEVNRLDEDFPNVDKPYYLIPL